MDERKGERLGRIGLDDEAPRPPASLIIECADGKMRAVSFQTGTKLVRRSVIVPENGAGVENMEIGERQLRGLGVLPDTRPGDFLDAPAPHGDPL